MNFCETHFDRLEKELRDRGLGTLITHDIDTMKAKLMDILDSGVDLDNFDPVCVAFHIVIRGSLRYALENGGRAAVHELGNGGPTPRTEWCPICYTLTVHDAICGGANGCDVDFELWIPMAADLTLQTWKSLNVGAS